jgi:F-type H+-transporting ATPase subunit b
MRPKCCHGTANKECRLTRKVVNEESILLAGFLIIVAVVAKTAGGPYTAWAQSHISVSADPFRSHDHFVPGRRRADGQRVKSQLNAAKAEHQKAVEERITSVKTLKEVVPLTEQLYAVARETNAIEHENFRLAQEQAVKAELKSVLDSWVRFEQQQREAEQVALVQTVRANVEAELAKPAFKKQLLEEALAQVERELISRLRGTLGSFTNSSEIAKSKAI